MAAEILVDPTPKAPPRGSATYRATGATWDKDKQTLTVKVKDGADVAVPPGAEVIVNGVKPYPAESVPLWFKEHAAECERTEAWNKAAGTQGLRAKNTPPVHFTLADTDSGPVARFDQR